MADFPAGGAAGPGASGIVPRPALFARLRASARVTAVSAPAGSGKTVLLRSWITEQGLAESAAWVSVGRDERDPQRFWLSVLSALGRTAPGSALVRSVTPAPDLDWWAIVEQLLKDLAPLEDRVWLVIDDVHELSAAEARQQLELLLMRGPPQLRFVLATRQDMQLGLHRLRLEGELTEIRFTDLRFTREEAAELFRAAGVGLSDAAVTRLHDRTEGWVAALRLAALSLTGHPDPERFAAEFAGSERTVAEYLVAEVLEHFNEPVRRLLLRTSLLDTVNGELADALTGASDGERILQELEEANAFVVSLDAARSWFRYYHLFADLLQLQLRRVAPGEVPALHRVAAEWFAEHGYPVDAIRHALRSQDWGLAARLLADHWPALQLGGQAATVHELLAQFPAEARTADAELAALGAADELAQGSLEAAERYLGLAEQASASAPTSGRGQLRLLLGVVGLLLARQRANASAVAAEAQRLQAVADGAGATQYGLSDDLRALALISLGIAEFGVGRFEEARRHLEDGVATARRIGRPYLEFTGLAYQTPGELLRSFAHVEDRGRRAIALAELHGWTTDPAAGIPYQVLGAVLAWQWRLEEAEDCVRRAERTLRAESEPSAAVRIYWIRGVLDLVRGRDEDALAAFGTAERLAGRLAEAPYLVAVARAWLVEGLVRLGEIERAEQVLANLTAEERNRSEQRIATAVLRLAQHDPQAAAIALTPILEGSTRVATPALRIQPFLLGAIALDADGDTGAAEHCLERALDLAEPDRMLLPFILRPVPNLLERHARRGSSHGALIGQILRVLAGMEPASSPAGPKPPVDPLSNSEIRVLRYLPTNLSAPEIANELYVSPNTVKTHIQNLYLKLGVHRRSEAVERACALGLLAPSTGRL